MTDERFPRRLRLRDQRDFDRVFQGKAYAADDRLVMNATGNGLTCTRLGISVSRKVGNAVVRNRWKRLIREAFRRLRTEMPRGLDCVVRPRKGAQPDFQAIKSSLLNLAHVVERRLQRERS